MLVLLLSVALPASLFSAPETASAAEIVRSDCVITTNSDLRVYSGEQKTIDFTILWTANSTSGPDQPELTGYKTADAYGQTFVSYSGDGVYSPVELYKWEVDVGGFVQDQTYSFQITYDFSSTYHTTATMGPGAPGQQAFEVGGSDCGMQQNFELHSEHACTDDPGYEGTYPDCTALALCTDTGYLPDNESSPWVPSCHPPECDEDYHYPDTYGGFPEEIPECVAGVVVPLQRKDLIQFTSFGFACIIGWLFIKQFRWRSHV